MRGFSPSTAGNTRIDGLYYDPVWSPSGRIRRSTAIRVGLSAQGFAFPAPTGIVDYALRRPGDGASTSIFVSGDTYTNAAIEVDAVVPITSRLSVAVGGGFYNNSFYNDTAGWQYVEGVTALWRPAADIEVQPFWSRSDIYDDEFGPTYIPAGPYLPPDVPRRRFLGPQLPKCRSTAEMYGSLFRYERSACAPSSTMPRPLALVEVAGVYWACPFTPAWSPKVCLVRSSPRGGMPAFGQKRPDRRLWPNVRNGSKAGIPLAGHRQLRAHCVRTVEAKKCPFLDASADGERCGAVRRITEPLLPDPPLYFACSCTTSSLFSGITGKPPLRL